MGAHKCAQRYIFLYKVSEKRYNIRTLRNYKNSIQLCKEKTGT